MTEKLTAWVIVTDDMLVDAGYDVPGYAKRVAAEKVAADCLRDDEDDVQWERHEE